MKRGEYTQFCKARRWAVDYAREMEGTGVSAQAILPDGVILVADLIEDDFEHPYPPRHPARVRVYRKGVRTW